MPAREMYFTFDKTVKVNKKTVLQFVEDFEYQIRENFNEIKKEFGVNGIDAVFLKEFIKVLKKMDNVALDDGDSHGKDKIVKEFIKDILGSELKEPTTVLGIWYLYDEWEYEATGYEDHYYYTYSDDAKLIKKTTKEVEKLVYRLNELGVNTKLIIK